MKMPSNLIKTTNKGLLKSDMDCRTSIPHGPCYSKKTTPLKTMATFGAQNKSQGQESISSICTWNEVAWIVRIFVILLTLQGSAADFLMKYTGNSSRYCHPCNEYHRKWASVVCENDINDCGDCYTGYHSVVDNVECLPIGDRVIAPSEIAAIPKGSDVVVNCQWSKIEDCVWARNGLVVEIGWRYQWHVRNEQECSLRIIDFQEIDVAEWSCHIFDSSYENDPSHVTHSWFSLTQPKLLHVKQNEVALVPIGQSVVLSCHFKMEVDCLWRHDEEPLKSDLRYSYLDWTHKGQGTRECSLRIDDFQEIDVGKWQCQSVSDSFQGSWKKISFELNTPVKPAKQITKLPPQHIVKIGSPVTLHCGYNVSVNCVWEKNGYLVRIGGRYRYTVEENGRDTKYCSLEILSLQSEDLGEWKCGYKHQQMTNYKLTSSTSLHVAPEVDITKEYEPPNGRRKRSVAMDNLSFKCWAKNSYPKAVIYWQWNGKDYHFGSRTVEQNGMFTTSITIDVAVKNPNSLMCIIQHPAFPYPKILRPDVNELTYEVRHGGSTYIRPTMAVIFMSIFLSIKILLWDTCILGGHGGSDKWDARQATSPMVYPG